YEALRFPRSVHRSSHPGERQRDEQHGRGGRNCDSGLSTRTMSRRNQTASQRGYAMAALLVGMSVMAIIMSVAMPVWNTAARRERETELIFRGEQYARAVALFQ